MLAAYQKSSKSPKHGYIIHRDTLIHALSVTVIVICAWTFAAMSDDSWPARSCGGAIDVGNRSAILWPSYELGIADTNEGTCCY